jgi:HD-like signal output (HDOD) protein
MDMNRFWSGSVMCALVARVGAEMCRAGELERYFVAGLLADLGHLVIYRVEPALAEQAHLLAEREGRPLHLVERELLGCDYAEVGAALMHKWALPDRLAKAIAGQIEPAAADPEFRRDACFVHLGRVLAMGLERQPDNDTLAARVDPAVWSFTDLKPANVATVRMIAEMGHAEVVALYFPQAQR